MKKRAGKATENFPRFCVRFDSFLFRIDAKQEYHYNIKYDQTVASKRKHKNKKTTIKLIAEFSLLRLYQQMSTEQS